ncbi:hypothetical protein [Bacillus tuaregi]|uniref:hypothetical protein n=1 Tax=Bacillus tuaregi TaxID=1816695 RepID=UPI0008F87DC6|nr:hypothetical protein [Bacillus tuaregi]
MEALKRCKRYKWLKKQFQYCKSPLAYKDIDNSLERILFYVYSYTNINYIEFIDDKVLYNYIKTHRLNNFREINFVTAISDVKNYLLFIEANKELKEYKPEIDLSVKNFSLWMRL